jgi:methionine aminopeptidase
MSETTLELLREAAQIIQEFHKDGREITMPGSEAEKLLDRAKQWLENAPLACLGLPENPQQIPLEGV